MSWRRSVTAMRCCAPSVSTSRTCAWSTCGCRPRSPTRGLRAALVIRRRWPDVAVLVLSQYVEERYAIDLIAGNPNRVGYLLKDRVADVDEFIEALRRVAAGGAALDPEVVLQLLARSRKVDPVAALSQRERDVLRAMAEGRSNAGIAAHLVVGEGAPSRSTWAASSSSSALLPPTASTGAYLPCCATWEREMSESRSPVRRAGPALSASRRAVLAFGMLPVLAACIGGGVVVTSLLRGMETFDYAAVSSAPGAGVAVNIGNAGLTVGPSVDGRVHLAKHGRYSGRRPTIGQRVQGDRLVVAADCRSTWLQSCRLDVDLLVPADLALVVDGGNGSIATHDLGGAARLRTENGAITVARDSGPLDLQTSNGSIDAAAVTAVSVVARTDNGRVDLDFALSPTRVDATTSNGHIGIQVPTSVSYFLTTHTDNGSISANIPSDRFAQRTITARTSNGSISITPRREGRGVGRPPGDRKRSAAAPARRNAIAPEGAIKSRYS